MAFQHLAGAAYRALTARKDGPSLYDVCDPVLLSPGSGDPHLCKFYRTALGNPALRPLLRRAGLAELREEGRLQRLRQALIAARDDEAPDWTAIGQPVAALLDTIDFSHPSPKPAPAPTNPPWRGIAEPLWEPMQIRHRSAYYDAFFTETLLSFIETGLASPEQAAAARRAIAEMVDFCLTTSREEVRAQDGSPFSV